MAKRKKQTRRQKSNAKTTATKSPPSKSRKATGLTSQRAIAAHFGRSVSTVHGWVHHAGWPFGTPSPSNPVSVADVAGWTESTFTKDKTDVGLDDASDNIEKLRRTMGSMDPFKLARMQKVRKETEILAKKVAVLHELYVDRDQVREEIGATIQHTKTTLLALPRRATDRLDSEGLLADGARREVEAELQGLVEAICRQFARGMSDATDGNGKHPRR